MSVVGASLFNSGMPELVISSPLISSPSFQHETDPTAPKTEPHKLTRPVRFISTSLSIWTTSVASALVSSLLVSIPASCPALDFAGLSTPGLNSS